MYMKNKIIKGTILASSLCSLTQQSAYAISSDLLVALNKLTAASNFIQSAPIASDGVLTQLSTITALNNTVACGIISDPTNSDFSTLNSFLSTQISTFQPLGTSTQATLSKIPLALLQASQALYSLANNATITAQSDLNTVGAFVINIVNELDTLALQWSLVSYLNSVDTTAHTALSGFATGTTGSWVYTTNTATTGWLQSMATNITAYIAKLVQLKSLSSFILSGTLKDIISLQGSLWVVDQQNNAIVQLSSDGTVLSTKTITTSSSGAQNITGSGSTLWFIEQTSRKIGKLTTSGTLTELSLGNQVTLTADSTGALTLTDGSGNTLSTVNAGWFTPGVGSGSATLTFANSNDRWGYLNYYPSILGDVITINHLANGNLSFNDNQGNTIPSISGGIGTTTFTHSGGSEPITINAASNGTISFYIDLGSTTVPTPGSSKTLTLYGPSSSISGTFHSFSVTVAANSSGTLSFTLLDSSSHSYDSPITNTIPSSGGSFDYYEYYDTGNTITFISDGTTIAGRIMLGTATPTTIGSTTTTLSLQASLSDTIAVSANTAGVISVTDTFGTTIGSIPNGGGSVTFTAFDSSPTSNLLIGPDARLWFGAFASSSSQAVLKAINTSSNAISEYVIGTSIGSITSVTTSPDGTALWLVTSTGKLIKVSTSGSILASYTLSAGANSIIVGPDNNLWIGKTNNQIEVRTTSGSAVQTYTTTAAPQELLLDSNNTVWFTEPGYIGKITTQGYFAEIPTSTTAQVYLTQGPDGNLWFTDPTTKTVYRIIS